jgi:hypothetical protein
MKGVRSRVSVTPYYVDTLLASRFTRNVVQLRGGTRAAGQAGVLYGNMQRRQLRRPAK